MHINFQSHSNQVQRIAISPVEINQKMTALLDLVDETLAVTPENRENKVFLFKAATTVLLSKIQKRLSLIFTNSLINQDRHIILTHKIGGILEQLENLSSKSCCKLLFQDYTTLHTKMFKLRVVKTEKSAITSVEEIDSLIISLMMKIICKPGKNFNLQIIPKIRALYLAHQLDAVAKSFPGYEQIIVNHQSFIKTLIEGLNHFHCNAKLNYLSLEEEDLLYPQIDHLSVHAEKSYFEIIPKCINLKSLRILSFNSFIDKFEHPELVTSLNIIGQYSEIKLSLFFNLEILQIDSGSLNVTSQKLMAQVIECLRKLRHSITCAMSFEKDFFI